jgi:transcriptional antiterminator RfaH
MVINTLPHREHLVLDNLHHQRFEAYGPFLRRRRSHARKVDSVLRPLFPNYLFVRAQACGEPPRWQLLLTTHGVRRVVRSGEQVSTLDDAFISGLRAREVDGVIVRPPSPYAVGQRVQIASGPFDRLIATIIDMDEKDRLVVLLDMMNRGIKATIKSECVMLA